METIKSKIIKGAKDRYGKTRKFIQIPELYYDDFSFGEVVTIQKISKNESKQES